MCPCTSSTRGSLLFCKLHSSNEWLSSPCSLLFVNFPFHCLSASDRFWLSIASPLDSQGLVYLPFFKVSLFIAGIYTKRKLVSGNPEEGLHEQVLHHRLVNWRLEGGIYDQGNIKSVFWKKEKFVLTSSSFSNFSISVDRRSCTRDWGTHKTENYFCEVDKTCDRKGNRGKVSYPNSQSRVDGTATNKIVKLNCWSSPRHCLQNGSFSMLSDSSFTLPPMFFTSFLRTD